MRILSVHDGHNASLCYLCDGQIKYLLLEERFTKKKNQGGFPEKAYEWLLKQNDFQLSKIDYIVLGCFDLPVFDDQTKNDFIHKLFFFCAELLPNQIISSNKIIGPYLKLVGIKRRRQIREYAEKYFFASTKIKQVEHHEAHGYAALYGSGFLEKGDPIVIFTIDNSGDGLSSTVSVWDRNFGYQRVHENQSYNSVGELYARVTEYLGMKPGEHEYKVMGMSPYVSDSSSDEIFNILKEKYLDLDSSGLKFINKASYDRYLINKMKNDFFKKRFDHICGGTQKHFEYLTINWVRNWTERLKIKKAVFGGGCFMNVKANMILSQLDIFDDVFFMPSSGDESASIGSAYKVHQDNSSTPISSLDHLYKGPRYTNEEVESILKKYTDKILYQKKDNIEKVTADLLVENKIVGRFKGNAEWGARSLGNRSILCRADDLGIIHKLNKAIKKRDFWMPFAPSILEEDADKYILNPKKIEASFMTLNFPTTLIARNHLAAGLHPFDHTCRPQLVSKKWSSDYHRLITYFKEKTGIGGILNTSFNLHGSPIVGTVEDAIETLLNSKLDYVAIEDYLVNPKEVL